ncbi:MAG: ASCH domain-containing protein [Eubacteriales bacterium]|nr:ASCH domain-containing protein [Eubacteriales bacterium]
MTAQEMWNAYQQQNPAADQYEAWAFCGGGPLADELAQLVLAGTKTATASARIAYETENEPLPKVGCYSVILYDNGDAACVIRATKVSEVPFQQVSAEHAYKEGEGDRTLEFWRRVHQEAFKPDYEAAGRSFDEAGLCVLEEFEVVYPAV